MAQKSTLTEINAILKQLDEESKTSLLKELRLFQGYVIAESIDKAPGSKKKVSMKEIVEEVKKARRKRNSGRKYAA